MKKIFIILFILLPGICYSGRPLNTDDAGILGNHKLQIETWLFADERSIQHWLVPTVGIGDHVEVSVSGVQGFSLLEGEKNIYSASGPILQSKILLRDTPTDGSPGLALSGGVLAPYGTGPFITTEWEYFIYLAGTSMPLNNDMLLLHVNLGRQTRSQFDNSPPVLLWGIATEVKTSNQSYCFAEVSNGEVYALIPGTISQVGFRYDLKPELQIDGSIGTGLSGHPPQPFWGTVGIRLITDFEGSHE